MCAITDTAPTPLATILIPPLVAEVLSKDGTHYDIAMRIRNQLRSEYQAALKTYDALLLPCSVTPPIALDGSEAKLDQSEIMANDLMTGEESARRDSKPQAPNDAKPNPRRSRRIPGWFPRDFHPSRSRLEVLGGYANCVQPWRGRQAPFYRLYAPRCALQRHIEKIKLYFSRKEACSRSRRRRTPRRRRSRR